MPERLNNAQLLAVTHGEGPMLVIAGPGSGKTYTITSRIAFLIKEAKVSPENILVITFTKEAAMNMQRRFREQFGAYGNVFFGTFHSCFYQILKRSGISTADSIMTDSDKKNLMIPLLRDFRKEIGIGQYTESDVLGEDAVKCLAAISYFKNTKDLQTASERLEEPYRSSFQKLLSLYEEKRISFHKMDYDDMLYQCLQLLQEQDEIRFFWQKQFRYLLIDEFQDCNPIQYEIVKILAGNTKNLFVVGDDDQSIYGFRGSDPTIMKRFAADFPETKTLILDRNYRSMAGIVEASNQVIRENRNRFDKKMKSAKEDSGTWRSEKRKRQDCVRITAFESRQEQYEEMIRQIRQFTEEEWKNQAVLFRTNSVMQAFAARLGRSGIAYSMREKGKCIYDHFLYQDITNYFRAAKGSLSRSLLLKIINKPYRGIGREILWKEQITFEEMRGFVREHYNGADLAEKLITIGLLEDGLRRLKLMSPYLAFTYLKKGMNYENYIRQKACGDQAKLEEWKEMLELIGTELKEFRNFEEWFSYQKEYRENWKKKQTDSEPAGRGIHLMTVHGAKGLEFDNVWIPDINEGVYPHGRILKKEVEEEERRMLYVAMTRAKKSLQLSFVTGTKDRPRLMSHFLKPLIS